MQLSPVVSRSMFLCAYSDAFQSDVFVLRRGVDVSLVQWGGPVLLHNAHRLTRKDPESDSGL